MKARRHLHLATDAGEPVLGYEAAIPHLMLPPGHSPPGRGAAAGRRSRGLVTSPLVLGAVLGLGSASAMLLTWLV